MENLKIDLHGETGNVNIRTGCLPALIELKKTKIEGCITAPFSYFNDKYVVNKNQDLPFSRMLVSFSKSKGTILFEENVFTTEGGLIVSGTMELDSDLRELGVNGKKSYTPTELSNALKMLKYMFVSVEDWMKSVTELKNFTAEFTSVVESSDDEKGNTKQNRITRLATSFDLSFVLKSPVFIGLKEESTFKVDIIVDVRSSNANFYLESVELRQIEKTLKNTVIEGEVSSFINNRIPVIELQ